MKSLFLWPLIFQQFFPSPMDYSLLLRTSNIAERRVWVAPDTPHSQQIPLLLHSLIKGPVIDKYIDSYISADPDHTFIGDLRSKEVPRFHIYSQSSIQRYNRFIEECPLSFVEFCSIEECLANILANLVKEEEINKSIIIYIPPLFLESDSVQSFLTRHERSKINWIVDSVERDKDADAVIVTLGEKVM